MTAATLAALLLGLSAALPAGVVPASKAPASPARKDGAAGAVGKGAKPAEAPPKTATVPGSVPTRVEAADIEYLNKERRTILTGKPLVTFWRADAVLVCRRMVADNDEAGDIRHAVCQGDVKLTRGDQVVTCQEAPSDAPADTIVCRGDPVLKDGASVLRSEEVVYDLARDRVLTHKSKGTIYQRPGQKLPGPKREEK